MSTQVHGKKQKKSEAVFFSTERQFNNGDNNVKRFLNIHSLQFSLSSPLYILTMTKQGGFLASASCLSRETKCPSGVISRSLPCLPKELVWSKLLKTTGWSLDVVKWRSHSANAPQKEPSLSGLFLWSRMGRGTWEFILFLRNGNARNSRIQSLLGECWPQTFLGRSTKGEENDKTTVSSFCGNMNVEIHYLHRTLQLWFVHITYADPRPKMEDNRLTRCTI